MAWALRQDADSQEADARAEHAEYLRAHPEDPCSLAEFAAEGGWDYRAQRARAERLA